MKVSRVEGRFALDSRHQSPNLCLMLDDTIAAIATPLGEGGLAVIRVSGPQALMIADRCFAPAGKASLKPSAAPTHTVQYGHIVSRGNSSGGTPRRP